MGSYLFTKGGGQGGQDYEDTETVAFSGAEMGRASQMVTLFSTTLGRRYS